MGKTIDNLAESGKRMARGIGRGMKYVAVPVAVAAALGLAACGDDSHTRTDPKNEAPTADLGRNFVNPMSRQVTYLLTGTDEEDGNNVTILAKFNGENSWTEYPNGQAVNKTIKEGTNTAYLKVKDSEGVESKVVSKSFVSPTEAEAEAIITSYLNERLTDIVEYAAEDIFNPSFGNSFTIDFNVLHWDQTLSGGSGNSRETPIEYVSKNENLNQKLSEKDLVANGDGDFGSEGIGFANLYIVGLPKEEMTGRLDWFFENCILPDYTSVPDYCK